MKISDVIRSGIDQLDKDGANVSIEEITGLDNEINILLAEIRKCPNIAAADEFFNELGGLQELLSLLLFKYNVSLSSKQKALVRQFDRSDDSNVRAIVYKAIKDSKFPELTDFIS